MGKPNEDLDLTNSKGDMVASLEGTDGGTLDIVFWNPPQPPNKGQGGNTHVSLSSSSLTLTSKTGKSKIVFSFSEDEEPVIELIRQGNVIWSSRDGE
ncbi:MAG: hypothetical protein AABO41_11215 [Acidobacteriota bacterium]